ncbi:DUF5665 domain-containing protein [Falsiruegeria mediterranea]|jgi:Domain of unknown function (DUF5665)|uniref:Uncharacterized protein n=1 Tax=Falsiruegeria mediterranea M17 TaxID=1200281 RepID=A0A2R8C6D2_9RHOB|nr:DUF5665 domain-containing protein [Falsiruegeria mediterranea]SPJ27972.1 hypothetical protein TRM7615_01466 [Falsiruegeria mediterranea M17]
MTQSTDEEIRALREEIAKFNSHRFVRVQNSIWLMLWQALLRGMAVGLGTVVGASILVSVLVYMLSQIDFLPIVGDWAKEISKEIQSSVGSNGEAASD